MKTIFKNNSLRCLSKGLACIFALFIIVSCTKKNIDTEYGGTNEIVPVLPTGGLTFKEGSSPEPLEVKVRLTSKLANPIEVDLKLKEDANLPAGSKVLKLSQEKLRFEAGEIEKSFTLQLTGSENLIMKQAQYELNIILPPGAPAGLRVKDKIIVIVNPMDGQPQLSDEQLRRLATSPVKIGLWTGNIQYDVHVKREGDGWLSFEGAKEFNFEDKSVIVPSETNENISTLDILSDAFGLERYYLEVYEGEVLDPMASFNPNILSKANYSTDKKETFKMSLKDLTFIPDSPGAKKGKVKYSKVNKSNEYIVPFLFTDFAPVEVLKKKAAQGDEDAKEYYELGLLEPAGFQSQGEGILNSYPNVLNTGSRFRAPKEEGFGTYDEETGLIEFVLRLEHSNGPNNPDVITVKIKSPQR